jgi:hypothetical protein
MIAQVARRWGVLVVGVGVALAAPAPRAESQRKAAVTVDLSGRWRFNKELSDDEQAKIRAATEAAAERQPSASGPSSEPEGEGSGGGRGGRGGRGGGAGGTSGRAGGGGLPASVVDDDPRGAKRSAGPPDAMTVTQTASEIVVAETPGQTRNLYPNGKTYETDDGAAQVRTSWKDGRLVVEKKNVHGWKLVEAWELTPDRGRVVIHLRLEGGSRPKLTLTRVYDRDDASTPK